ncbi:putative oxidoreductase [Streptomyces lavendulae subsp. lavendulae]|uniref:Putative oxidoreductase n=1 Tax=Streptomyces lavendulae subsp. lavendulae TaxID=58340 RepID=A0A2K8P9Q2_STRLA|nr:aldo/keto reductase [Streptomyces lavendulae]ATZ23467.1 putative oxidoreductase [Streptomyces lavendulae subsp. lavendulae]QUQ53298.1 putative oxidoreductase [Streptomyces lavendulae subsp. lavendulae]
MKQVPSIRLNNGTAMPQLGFGVWQVPDSGAESAVGTALEAGYRSIDTAAIYGNERGTGRAVAASGVPRGDLFVTTKLWNGPKQRWGRDQVLRAFDDSLDKLGLDHLDLYLIHWPRPMRDDFLAIWKTFEEIAASGRAKAVGVSNFRPADLERLRGESDLVPAVNQIELHPLFPQEELRALHASLGIVTEAWSPLGQGKELLTLPAVAAVAAKHGRSAAQVVLRWHLQLGNVVIPKSVTPARIRENLDVFGFELDAADLAELSALGSGAAARRIGPDPAVFDV